MGERIWGIAIIGVFYIFSSTATATWDYEITAGYFDNATIAGDQQLLMTGGSVVTMKALDSSYIEIRDTDPLSEIVIEGIETIILEDNSRMNYYGGYSGQIRLYDDSHAVLTGGHINSIWSLQRPLSGSYPPSYLDKHVEIICKEYQYNSITKKLTGYWEDDTAFDIYLIDESGYHPAYSNIIFTIVPEPATLALLGLGGLLLRSRASGI